MKKPPKNGVGPIDEHDQPTEPMNFVVSPYAPTVTGENPVPDAATMPVAPGRPFPQQQVPPQPPLIGAYPFLPPIPVRQSGKPGSGIVSIQPENSGIAMHTRPKRRSLFPAFVGLVFVAIQLLLLVRFGLSMIGLWDNLAWVKVFYDVTSLLVWPVQTLVQRIPLPLAATQGISTLLAILLYGLLSRILVRCLKLLFRTR